MKKYVSTDFLLSFHYGSGKGKGVLVSHANDQNRTVIEPVTKKQKGIIPFDYGSILIMHGCVKDL